MPLELAKPLRPFQAEKQQQESLNELQRHCWEHSPVSERGLLQPTITSNHRGHVTCPSKTAAPNPALPFSSFLLISPHFSSSSPPPPLPHGVTQPRPGFCCERDQRVTQPGETKSLCDQCVPSWQWRGSRKHFPKELLLLLPIQMVLHRSSHLSSFEGVREGKEKICKVCWLVRF